MAKVSVVIPIYLSEQYLPRCLDSLLAQSFSDFELILVDDGSPDQCGRICDEYASKDNRVVVIHQLNAGVSTARNCGLSKASGEYIVFVDSDDWVKPDYISDLIASEADFVSHSFVTLDENDTQIKQIDFQNETVEVTPESILSLLSSGVLGYTFSKRFSRKIIEENKIRFIEEIDHTEDTLFIIDYLRHAKLAEIKNKPNYCYIRYKSRTTLSNNISLERLAMACVANSLLCDRLFASKSAERDRLYYCRVAYNYISYFDKVYNAANMQKLWKYCFYMSLLLNEDVNKIIEYEPDAVWKLNAHSRVIHALIKKNKYDLFIASIFELLSAIKRRFSRK